MSFEFEPQRTLFEIGPEIAHDSGANASGHVVNTPPLVPKQPMPKPNTAPDDNTSARAKTLYETGQITADEYNTMTGENDTTAPGSSSAQTTGSSTSQIGPAPTPRPKASGHKRQASGIGHERGTLTGSDIAGAIAREAYDKRIKSGTHLNPMNSDARASLSELRQQLDRAEEARWVQELKDQGKTGDALENALNALVIAREAKRERAKKNP